MRFTPCQQPTVGVELELQLLDRQTLDLANGIVPLLELFPDRRSIRPELIQSCVEISCPPCATCDEARQHLLEVGLRVHERAHELGMALSGGGTHGFGQNLALITPRRRYQKIEKTMGILPPHQIVFSTHVHVGMPSGNTALFVMRHLAPCLPALLAVAANSPFWRGYDTGFACYRQCILATSQTYGLPPILEDWNDFVGFFEACRRADIVRTIKDLHWDLRPHPDFGTLELRIYDAASTIAEAAAIAAFARALMVYLIDHVSEGIDSRWPAPLPHWPEHVNRYRAAHIGLDAPFIVDKQGTTRPLREVIVDLTTMVRPQAEALGDGELFRDFERYLSTGGGANHQRQTFARESSMQAVVGDLVDRLSAELGRNGRNGRIDHAPLDQAVGA